MDPACPADLRRGVLLDSGSDSDDLRALPLAHPRRDQKRDQQWDLTPLADLIDAKDMPWSTRRALRRKLGTTVAADVRDHSAYVALQAAWDRQRLLAGDTVTPGASYGRHANCWNPESVVRLAFEAVGKGTSVAMRSESHNIPTMSECVAYVGDTKLQHMVESLARDPPSRWIYIERASDATPVHVELGALQDILYDIAKYRFLREDGTWTLIPYEEAQQLKLRCKRGVVQLFAQSLRLVWKEPGHLTDPACPPGFDVLRVETVPLRPVFLEAANASCEFQAMDDAVPALTLASIFTLTAKCRYVCLALMGDGAGSNTRQNVQVMSLVQAHNAGSDNPGKVLCVENTCMGHTFMAFLKKVFGYVQLIPRCYSLNYTLRFPPRYNKLVCLLRAKVERDLLGGGYVMYAGHSDEHEEWQARTAVALSLTLLRVCRVRGRNRVEGSTGRTEDMLMSICGVLRGMLNSDTGAHAVAHLCRNCCTSAREAANKITDAVVTAFVELIAGKVPSTSKCYTLAETKTAVCGFELVHHLGSRLIPPSVGCVEEDNDGNVEGDEIAQFRARNNHHARQCKAAAIDDDFHWSVLTSTWLGEPIERASAEMQHAESVGQCWLDVTYKDGILRSAERDFFLILTSSPDTPFGLSAVVAMFNADGTRDSCDLEQSALGIGMDLAAQLESRAIDVVSRSPYSWLQLKDERNCEAEIEALRTTILNEYSCNLDPCFGRIVVADARLNPATMDEIADGVLHAISRFMPATNFGLEGLLSRIRSSCHKGANRDPRAERIVTNGFLTQLMLKHVNAGLADSRGKERREDLLRAGVQLNCVGHQLTRHGERRWHIRYGNFMVKEAKKVRCMASLAEDQQHN